MPCRYNARMVSLQTFSASSIAAAAGAAGIGIAVEVVPETDSTNADLLVRAGSLGQPLLLVAQRQNAGRGRAGRSWHAEPGASLAMSLAWPMKQPRRAWPGLPLAVAVTMAEFCEAKNIATRIKWPNDLLLTDGAKLAGILVEAAPAARDGKDWAVIGIGLNLRASAGLQARVGHAIGAAPALADDIECTAGGLLSSLAHALRRFDEEGLAPFAPRWNARHAHADAEVMIVDRGALLHQGVARGIDTEGRLLLDTGAGRVAVASGDVSLRAAHARANAAGAADEART